MIPKISIQPRPPCLMATRHGWLCMTPSVQIHPVHGPICALHLYHERRSQQARPSLQVRVDAEDLEALDRLAKTHNLTRSDAFRRVLRHLPFPKAKVDADTYFELRKIGVNLNQMARAMNRGDELDPDSLHDYLDILYRHCEEVALRLCEDPSTQCGR